MAVEWTTSCVDWADRLKTGRSIIPAPLFPDEAETCLQVMRELRIVDAPGSPTIGEACAPWVFELAASIFGAYDKESGRRLITEWFVCVPKKNSKSTIAGALMLTSLIRNWRESAEFSILSPTLEVSNNSFAPCRDMVRKDDELDALLQVQTHIKTITHRGNAGTLKVSAADSNTVGGKKSVGTLVDELWLFGKQSTAENMLREAIGGLASRPEGFVIYLTTQSDEPPAGVFRQKLQYARDVRDGKIIDKRFVPVIYEFPDDMVASGDYKKPENFGMVNPNIGYSVDREFLEREFTKTQATGEESMRGFLAKHLNVEIGLNLRSDRWAGAEFWEAQSRPVVDLDYLLANSEVITVGIDGGGLDDMLGFAAIGREAETGRWILCNHAWLHPVALERRKQEMARYKDFETDGNLNIIEALPDDVSEVAEMVKRIYDTGLLAGVGLDPEKTHKVMFQALVDIGVDEKIIMGVSQGWKLIGSIIMAERKLAEKKMIHGGTRLMNWCVGNARIEPRGNAALITKQASGNAKIDPLMATFNAVSLMALNPAGSGKSFWE
jgi:phage terminase large subunit-like protein